MEWVFSLAEIRKIAATFWKNAAKARVFAVHGEMGAGKTTFIHALCDTIGVRGPVTSPTFSIINEYSYKEDGFEKKLYHLDLYRLKDEEEAFRAGIEDCLYSESICFVEWPEKAPGIFPQETLPVYIEIIDSARRKLRTDDKIS